MAAVRPSVSVDDRIRQISSDIDSINRAIGAYNANRENADAEIERHLNQLDALYTQLSEMDPGPGSSDDFKEHITTMQVNVLKSIQEASRKVKRRSRQGVPVNAKLNRLLIDRDYTDEEFRLFVIATNLLHDYSRVRRVSFLDLSPERQAIIDEFFFKDVCSLIHDGKPLQITPEFNEQMLVLKILIRDLLAQIIGTDRVFPPDDDNPENQLKRKLIAKAVFMATYGDDRSFSDNITLLLTTLTPADIAKGAFTGAVFFAVAKLNPGLYGLATSAGSMAAEATTVAAGAAAAEPLVATGTAWYVGNFVRERLRREDDMLGRGALHGIDRQRKQDALDRIFGERREGPIDWWNVLEIVKGVARFGTEALCRQVEVARDMFTDLRAMPDTSARFCSRALKRVNRSISSAAAKFAAARSTSTHPQFLTKFRAVLDDLLETDEFASLVGDEYILRTQDIFGLLDQSNGITRQQVDRFLAQQISMHGITPAFEPISDTAQTDFYPDSDDDAMREKVFGQTHDARQEPTVIEDPVTGAAVGLMEPAASRNAATASNPHANSQFGDQLMKDAVISRIRGLESNVGPGGIIHTRPFPVPKSQVKGIGKDKGKIQKNKGNGAAADSNMSEGGGRSLSRKRSASKRTRHRKATTKKQKSKKNKQQSRRKVRRSSSRRSRK